MGVISCDAEVRASWVWVAVGIWSSVGAASGVSGNSSGESGNGSGRDEAGAGMNGICTDMQIVSVFDVSVCATSEAVIGGRSVPTGLDNLGDEGWRGGDGGSTSGVDDRFRVVVGV